MSSVETHNSKIHKQYDFCQCLPIKIVGCIGSPCPRLESLESAIINIWLMITYRSIGCFVYTIKSTHTIDDIHDLPL